MMFDAKFASLALPMLVGKGINDDEYEDNNSDEVVANKRATRTHCAVKRVRDCTLSQPGGGGMGPACRMSGW